MIRTKQKNKLSSKYINISHLFKKLKWIKNKIPIVICGIFFMCSLVPINNHFLIHKPPLFFIPFFYWIVKSPQNMGFIYIITISFLYDILEGNIFGLNIFLITVIYAFLLYQKLIPINKNFAIHYVTFIFIMLFYYIVKYILYSSILETEPNIEYIIINYLFLLTLYPLFYLLMKKLNK